MSDDPTATPIEDPLLTVLPYLEAVWDFDTRRLRIGGAMVTPPDRSVPLVSDLSLGEIDNHLGDQTAVEAGQQFARRERTRTDRTLRAAIRETDWDETAVLDVVVQRPTIEEMPTMPDHEVHRYADTAPPLSEYADGEHRYDVRRITRPLCERLGVDPETGAFEGGGPDA